MKIELRSKIISLFVAVLFVLTGYASAPKVSIPTDVKIESVSVSEAVQTPEDVYYLGPGPGFGVGMLSFEGSYMNPPVESSTIELLK